MRPASQRRSKCVANGFASPEDAKVLAKIGGDIRSIGPKGSVRGLGPYGPFGPWPARAKQRADFFRY
jgi:hypothetical protein